MVYLGTLVVGDQVHSNGCGAPGINGLLEFDVADDGTLGFPAEHFALCTHYAG